MQISILTKQGVTGGAVLLLLLRSHLTVEKDRKKKASMTRWGECAVKEDG